MPKPILRHIELHCGAIFLGFTFARLSLAREAFECGLYDPSITVPRIPWEALVILIGLLVMYASQKLPSTVLYVEWLVLQVTSGFISAVNPCSYTFGTDAVIISIAASAFLPIGFYLLFSRRAKFIALTSLYQLFFYVWHYAFLFFRVRHFYLNEVYS